MIAAVSISALVVTLAGLIVLRRELKGAPLMPPDYGHDVFARLPSGMQAALRAEEIRQKPEERRN